jgi:proteasome lid subunit RPN8/RPN11
MRRRIEMDPALPPATLPRRVWEELARHAADHPDEECCGLLSGNEETRFRTVHRCQNVMTERHQQSPQDFPRDNREAFYVNEKDFLRAQDDAEAHGERLTAVYHSHVGFGVYFSELDQEFAGQERFPFPNAAHIVISVESGRAREMGLFERDPASQDFVGRRLEPKDP